MTIPFPLASGRYETGPAMRRFGQAGQGFPAESGHFQPDDRFVETIDTKLALLLRAPEECHLTARGAHPGALRATLLEAFRLLAAEHPHLAVADGEAVSLRHLGLRLAGDRAERVDEPWPGLAEAAEYLTAQHGLALWGNALALAAQEDLAIVTGPGGTLEWLHVCLPSGWAPAEKIGLPFGAVHQPVAHSEALVAGQERIVRAMIEAGPFVRYVWGIHRDGALCHNPRLHRSAPWGDNPATQAWFRVERQTTKGFPALNRALFTIRYWVEPLTDTAADPWRRERLCTALAGMDEVELAYKGLTPAARQQLVDWLST
jgi:dimethylamine monooxygenase subunit A